MHSTMTRSTVRGQALPLMEGLEPRQLMSVAPAAAHHPVSQKHSGTAKHVRASATTPAPLPWGDLVGNWTGTFMTNVPKTTPLNFSASFTYYHGKSTTGTFNLGAMIGQSNLLTTVTPDVFGNVPVTVPFKNGVVCFLGGLSLNGKMIVGRWCSWVGVTITSGTFQMTRP